MFISSFDYKLVLLLISIVFHHYYVRKAFCPSSHIKHHTCNTVFDYCHINRAISSVLRGFLLLFSLSITNSIWWSYASWNVIHLLLLCSHPSYTLFLCSPLPAPWFSTIDHCFLHLPNGIERFSQWFVTHMSSPLHSSIGIRFVWWWWWWMLHSHYISNWPLTTETDTPTNYSCHSMTSLLGSFYKWWCHSFFVV